MEHYLIKLSPVRLLRNSPSHGSIIKRISIRQFILIRGAIPTSHIYSFA